MGQPIDKRFLLGDFLVEPQLNRIRHGDRKVQIESKAMDVLVYLADHPRRVLSKERIIQAVWPDVAVTDDVVTHAISKLRRALDDDPGESRYIQTIPRKGYRLIAPVASSPDASTRYRILKKIGHGVTGEVHLAEDRVLKRKVALKFLGKDKEADEVWRKRLLREAQSAAALDHPFICKVYDTGELDDRAFIAMEYVEGPTLKDKLEKGPLPLDEALQTATEIAQALETAHKQSVVHRDLKPSSIMFTSAGNVKLVDFGLAKQVSPLGPGASQEETFTGQIQDGVTVGTLAYMSPEQLRGEEVDLRSDIFSFGIVLYEMLTGRNPFRRPEPMETASSILKDEPPPLSQFVNGVPVLFQETLTRMLAKDPAHRYQQVEDLRANLQALSNDAIALGDSTGPTEKSKQGEAVAAGSWRQITPWFLAAAFTGAIGTLIIVWMVGPSHPPSPVTRFAIYPPQALPIANTSANDVAISPDGRKIAYFTTAQHGSYLCARSLDDLVTLRLPDTAGSFQPFFSPDSRSVAFFTYGDNLARLSLEGGSPDLICEIAPGGNSGSWGSEQTIVFSGNHGQTLYRVSARGGRPEVLLTSRGGERYFAPHFLPERKIVLFTRWTGTFQIAALRLETGKTTTLIEGGSQPFYASSGHLIYAEANTGNLMAASFEIDRLDVTGQATLVQTGIRRTSPGPVEARVGSTGWIDYAISDSGTLVYIPGESETYRLVRFDRGGNRLGFVGKPGAFGQIALSSDDKRVVIERLLAGNWDLWLLELSTGILSRLTRHPATDRDPVWSPDGRQIAFSSDRQMPRALFLKDLHTGQEELLFSFEEPIVIDDWTRNGQSIVFRKPGRGLYSLAVEETPEARLLSDTPYIEDQLQVSPDGRWIAFNSNESDRWEVYVASFPDFNDKRQVSDNGGVQPLWRKDGQELFYLSLDGKVMAIETKTGGSFEAEISRMLFESPLAEPSPYLHEYSVTGDGQRFLIKERLEDSEPPSIVVVQNWFEELKRLVPTQE